MNFEEKELKIRENRLRRKLANQGYSLKKNRPKVNPNNVGGYMIINLSTKSIECGGEARGFTLDLDNVERFIAQKDERNPDEERERRNRENRARRKLSSEGLRLMKNRAKSYPNNLGGYMIVDSTTNAVELGSGFNGKGYGMKLEEIEKLLPR